MKAFLSKRKALMKSVARDTEVVIIALAASCRAVS